MKRWVLLILVVAVAAALFLFRAETGNLAVVAIQGGIFEPDPILRELDDLVRSDRLKAVVLRIDSPGGTVGAAQEIHDAVLRLAEKKKVVASFGSVAASGAYYVAVPTHKIVANPGTLTGSIGVRMEYVNLEEILGWVRLHPETLKSGRWKDIGSPTRPMTPEERAFLDSILRKMHDQFKAAIARGRHLDPAVVDQIGEGQIYTGEEAVKLGLVDELGNLDRAIRVAADLAGIEGEPEVFYPSKRYESLLERFLGEAVQRGLNLFLERLTPRVYFLY